MMKRGTLLILCLLLCALTASCAQKNTTTTDAATDTTSETVRSTVLQTESVPQTTEAPDGLRDTTFAASTVQSTESRPAPQAQSESDAGVRFADLPSQFVFASGAGGWDTTLNIRSDGSFEGVYHDSDYKTFYYSTFDGQFGTPRKQDANAYSVKIEKLNVTNDLEKVYFGDDTEYIASTPYGIEKTNELILYLPGTPLSVIPEDCLDWLFLEDDASALPDDTYVLFNAQEGDAFVGIR